MAITDSHSLLGFVLPVSASKSSIPLVNSANFNYLNPELKMGNESEFVTLSSTTLRKQHGIFLSCQLVPKSIISYYCLCICFISCLVYSFLSRREDSEEKIPSNSHDLSIVMSLPRVWRVSFWIWTLWAYSHKMFGSFGFIILGTTWKNCSWKMNTPWNTL